LLFHLFLIPAKLLRISQHNHGFDDDVGKHCEGEPDDCPHNAFFGFADLGVVAGGGNDFKGVPND